jgi:hypothetical protein
VVWHLLALRDSLRLSHCITFRGSSHSQSFASLPAEPLNHQSAHGGCALDTNRETFLEQTSDYDYEHVRQLDVSRTLCFLFLKIDNLSNVSVRTVDLWSPKALSKTSGLRHPSSPKRILPRRAREQLLQQQTHCNDPNRLFL